MSHIVHLETGRHLYGGGRQVLTLMDGLVDQGFRCTLVCPMDSEIRTATNSGVQVQTMSMAGDLDASFAFRFGKWLDQADADLVHVHSRRGADLWGGMGAKWANVPAVLSRRVDNPEVPVMGPMKYRRYARVIGISEGILKQLRKIGVSEEKLRLVHSAVNVDACQPSWTREQFLDAFGLKKDNLAVVCVAQFIPRKDHHGLIEAWSDVVGVCPDARLLLFGRGPEEENLQKIVQQSVLGSTVHFAGFRDDLRQFIGCADVLVHPALSEGLGIALLEAQAAGVPVVATRVGGIPEAVADGKSGSLVEPGDTDKLARALIRLLRDADLRQRLGEGGRVHVANNFGTTAMIAGNLAVYKELLEETSQAGQTEAQA
jgi:glycosyltransferase involved in cell wall biosynthesis